MAQQQQIDEIHLDEYDAWLEFCNEYPDEDFNEDDEMLWCDGYKAGRESMRDEVLRLLAKAKGE
jgi:hypothetical protein